MPAAGLILLFFGQVFPCFVVVPVGVPDAPRLVVEFFEQFLCGF